MADSNTSRGHEEDSGLINLDALMGTGAAEEPAPPAPVAMPALPPVVAPPRVSAPPPLSAVAKVPSLAPAPASMRPDDSLEGVASAKPSSVAPPPASSTTATAVASTRAAKDEPREKRRLVPILLGVAAVLGIGAVVLHPWRSTSMAATPPKPVIAAAPIPTTPAVTKTTAAEPAAETTAVPTAGTATPAPTATVAAKAAAAAAPKPEAKATVTEKDLGVTPTGEQGDLAGAMKGAVGAKDTVAEQQKGADNSGAFQVRPAAGQVVGAIGAVLPAARACLGSDDTIRSGSMVFASDGSVKAVSLSGGAKPSDDCIKSALSKAKLQPFADDSFTTRVTVRP